MLDERNAIMRNVKVQNLMSEWERPRLEPCSERVPQRQQGIFLYKFNEKQTWQASQTIPRPLAMDQAEAMRLGRKIAAARR